MQELINKIKESAGVSDEQAQKSIDTVSDYLKGKMPESFGEQIDKLLAGGTLSDGVKGSLKSAAHDAKDKMEDVFKDVSEKTSDAVDNIKDKIDDIFKKKS